MLSRDWESHPLEPVSQHPPSPNFTFCQAGDELCFSLNVSPWWLSGSIIRLGPGGRLTVWHWVTLSNGISVKIIVTILCTDKSPIKYNVILMPSISSYSLNTDEETQTNTQGGEILFGLFCEEMNTLLHLSHSLSKYIYKLKFATPSNTYIPFIIL